MNMKVTYCQDVPKKFICERDEVQLPGTGGFVELNGIRYAIRRVEKVAREALAYVMPD
jgi:ribosomal protein S12